MCPAVARTGGGNRFHQGIARDKQHESLFFADRKMTEITDQSLQAFLQALASNSATPGGGSVAALMGAQGAALLGMVCHLTLGNPKYATVETEMELLLKQSEALRERLTAMVEADVDVFNRLMAAYRLPRESDAEKSKRNNTVQALLQEATLVPLACAEACAEVIRLSRVAAEKGNPSVVSDAGVAVMAGYAGLKSAALNVWINVASVKDRQFAEAKSAQLQRIVNEADAVAAEVYRFVASKL